MKTREQLIDKITVEKILRWLEKLEMLTSKATKVVHVKNLLVRQSDIVVEACEEVVKETEYFQVIQTYPDGSKLVKKCNPEIKDEILQNLKKLKSK